MSQQDVEMVRAVQQRFAGGELGWMGSLTTSSSSPPARAQTGYLPRRGTSMRDRVARFLRRDHDRVHRNDRHPR